MEIVKCDLMVEADVMEAAKDCDYIIHTAGKIPNDFPKKEMKEVI